MKIVISHMLGALILLFQGLAHEGPMQGFPWTEATGADTVSVSYVEGGPGPSDPVGLQVSGVFFYHNNLVGTPAAITDSERNVVWRGEFFPFGDVVDATVTKIGNHKDRWTADFSPKNVLARANDNKPDHHKIWLKE
jgi:hypothetical protein